MTVLLALDSNRTPRLRGEALARTLTPAKPANEGSGDVRKKIVPVVKQPVGPSLTEWEGGQFQSLQEWLDAPQPGGGILIQPADDVRKLEGRLGNVGLIAIEFHRIGDGRGYTHAFLLRHRLGYAGPLRAVNAITADQVYALARVGFDSFALRADQEPDAATNALRTFTTHYQSDPLAIGSLHNREQANFEAKIKLLERVLADIAKNNKGAALASSLSAEDMVLTDVIARLNLPIDVFTLETGRLHPETLALVGETKAKYGLDIKLERPDPKAVEDYVSAYGRDGFYDGVPQRKACCNIRKVVPLARALEGRGAWITGQRREQAVTRGQLAETERDEDRHMDKYNPLADWSWADVLAYAARFDIPMNPLYQLGYVSIGCEPCTKATRPGEDPRAGRWWWEAQDSRECGLHVAAAPAAIAAE
jgi:phosphoadenosine phosphosulfate reductase